MKFRVNNKVGAAGTFLVATFEAKPAELIKVFGEPSEGDGYKVSMEWRFIDELYNVYTVYDYKQTNLYSSQLPSPEEIRGYDSLEFHIGANDIALKNGYVKDFINFLKKKLKSFKNYEMLYEKSFIKGILEGKNIRDILLKE